MKRTIICNATIINEGRSFPGSVLIEGDIIAAIHEGEGPAPFDGELRIDAAGLFLIPGAIDDQVHFREPGHTHKGDIAGEAAAAVAGGVTSFMDMPNTVPPTTTVEALEWKFRRAAETSPANFSFFPGGTNDNFGELLLMDPGRIPGLKLFLGTSTGNLLIDDRRALERIFGESNLLIAVHAEKEDVIRRNIAVYTEKYGPDPDMRFHPAIRSAEACYACSAEAVELALRLGARLHILHISTARELDLLEDERKALREKQITSEVCLHHLWFSDEDYARLGSRIKWNPAVKTAADREALRRGLASGLIDIAATDHAPHLLSEKEGGCLRAASGGPMVQHSVAGMWELAEKQIFSRERVVEVMSHRPADLFRIRRRGYIREGYYADLVLLEKARHSVSADRLLYKCGWSPFEGLSLEYGVRQTFVNGEIAYDNGSLNPAVRGRELEFER
ncbi:MAG: dihydroorotase [Tannerellaceae bacterium]|jgi:dihydroorotase|nr:dihydroorotase [Tannerellaceae bacterium]